MFVAGAAQASNRGVYRILDTLKLLRAPLLVLRVALLELRDHFRARPVDRVHHVFVLPRPALGDEDHQVEVRAFELAQRVLDELRRADAAAALGRPPERARHLVLRLFRRRLARGVKAAEAAEGVAKRPPALLRRRVDELLVNVRLARL